MNEVSNEKKKLFLNFLLKFDSEEEKNLFKPLTKFKEKMVRKVKES